jgi:low affinity Fe/Cu permease
VADETNKGVLMPTDVSSRVGVFDRFAGVAAHVASRAAFFLFCVLLVIVWFPSIILIRNVDTWQLIINTATTIITFLMVALLQNSQTRSDQAVQHKLNAIADGLAELMAATNARGERAKRLGEEVEELRAAVGLEEVESTSKNQARGGARAKGTTPGKRRSPAPSR